MAAANRQGFRGYVTSRPFGEYYVPVPLQSLALRDYCANNKMMYVLPANENIFPNSYMVLEGMVQDLSNYQGMVMCSMHMLPRREERRRQIYDRILSQGCALHLVFERMVIDGKPAVEQLEELLKLNQIAARLPKEQQAH